MTDDPSLYDCEHGYTHGECWVTGCNHQRPDTQLTTREATFYRPRWHRLLRFRRWTLLLAVRPKAAAKP